ncbi:Aristolochene synthase in complex with 12,13 Difluorofarnesyl diphosphate [Periconia macrospinosa]|uniref:Terpene synthase n=1 Tax=Periconia macrospinosa TaxID=97972 RepID=A0A2V1CYK2_9PLEO|nr:Aristolochene synthase in complex with 12,13 Difluorofarnesyl diphosphate [Periconia macrospinosa]
MLKNNRNKLNGFTKPQQSEEVPAPHLQPKCHPLEPQITEEVDGYFIKNWPFPNEKAIQRFRAAGFSKVTCCYYPEALNDRIHFGCRLLTLLFLIDGMYLLEHMSLEDGRVYNEKLMPISRGDVLPDRNIPVEWITYDLWESMRAFDRKLADEILEPVFTFMRAQTDPRRKKLMDFSEYLEYRERDVGKALLSALMRYVMKLELTEEELELVKPCDRNCSKHISVVNDIYSWEKELKQSIESPEEGSVLCSSVQVVMHGATLNTAAAKRVLWPMCREWELVHLDMVDEFKDQGVREDVLTYCKGLEYQMSGNELWSSETLRYHNINL